MFLGTASRRMQLCLLQSTPLVRLAYSFLLSSELALNSEKSNMWSSFFSSYVCAMCSQSADILNILFNRFNSHRKKSDGWEPDEGESQGFAHFLLDFLFWVRKNMWDKVVNLVTRILPNPYPVPSYSIVQPTAALIP